MNTVNGLEDKAFILLSIPPDFRPDLGVPPKELDGLACNSGHGSR
jgi:hypothetical protein